MSDQRNPPGEGRGNRPQRERADTGRRPGHRDLDDMALVAAMRTGDPRAVDEFIVRYQRLLFARARLAGIPRCDCEDRVIEVIEEIAILIVKHRVRPTKALGAYVVKSFFNKIADAAEDAERRRRIVEDNTEDAPGRGERLVMTLSSEHSIRASQGPDWEPVTLSPTLELLASTIDEGLTEEERRLLSWHSQYIPLRKIAVWLELSYAAAAQRSWRLRRRLREAAVEHASSFSIKQRRELADFFDRCHVTYDGELRSRPDDDPSTRSA